MQPDNPNLSKEEIRRRIWSLMEESNIASFPRPVYGRIPNFVGSDIAARRLSELEEFKRARVVKVNPDAPQITVRYLTLLEGKMLLMPTPRLKSGFLMLNPKIIPKRAYGEASSIRGAFKYGKACGINETPTVDLIVAGSVAVSRDGVRVGKGGGYSEIEYGVLREIGAVDENTPILTTVHDAQIVDFVPKDVFDLTVNAIVTPSKTIRIENVGERPRGIIWDRLSEERIREIPILAQLKRTKPSN
ncbi:MAG: 5-formyltetrahydrofolate cyclo-ligase [Candidatus Bathyarchaeota archaeon]|nr:5-formyltetrahydrofolate cyclo-ligase [Candidatus Bathyarchaeota archaeon]